MLSSLPSNTALSGASYEDFMTQLSYVYVLTNQAMTISNKLAESDHDVRYRCDIEIIKVPEFNSSNQK